MSKQGCPHVNCAKHCKEIAATTGAVGGEIARGMMSDEHMKDYMCKLLEEWVCEGGSMDTTAPPLFEVGGVRR